MAGLKPEWRAILQRRSMLDKIGVPIDCDLARPGDLNIVAELVREGIIEWIDRINATQMAVMTRDGKPVMTASGAIRHPNLDVYKLTPKGVALCDANGIEGH